MEFAAVIDTTVLVSALLKAGGPNSRIIDAVSQRRLVPVFDERILAEYADVLSRPKFSFGQERVDALLWTFRRVGGHARVVPPSPLVLRDPGDVAFIEVAMAHRLPVVSRNLKDFPSALGIEALTATDMLQRLGIHDQ